MFIRSRPGMILLCGCLVPVQLIPAPQQNLGQGEQSLRAITKGIGCAATEGEARYHLQNLQTNRLFPPGLPDESSNSHAPELRASTVNKVLAVLYKSAKKYPANKFLIEKTVTQWNFCSIIDNGKFFDHYRVSGKTVRSPSAMDANDSWNGFRAFGLLPGTTRNDVFDFSSPYKSTVIRALADSKLQQTYITHCLPHPDDEHLYRDVGRNFITRVQPSTEVHSPLKEAGWSIECKPEEPALTHATKLLKDPAETPVEMQDATSTSVAEAIFIEPVPTVIEAVTMSEAASALAASIESPVPASVEVPIPTAEFDPVIAAATEPVGEVPPIVVTGTRNGNDIVTPSPSRSKGFSGSLSVNNSAFKAENTSLNFALSYKPVKDSYWFIRTGVNLSQNSKPLTYSWGFGYDDWHPGTWAIQLNHWGPLKPGDGLDIDNAVAEVSYKIKMAWLEKRKLSSSIALSKPLSTEPLVNWGWSWNPHSHWFVRSTLSKPIDESGLNWSYGFGYTRYNTNSLSIEYNNWGPNEFPDHNFKKNALISLIYRWAF